MQKINLRELYPDVYKTDVFVDVAEDKKAQELFIKEFASRTARYS